MMNRTLDEMISVAKIILDAQKQVVTFYQENHEGEDINDNEDYMRIIRSFQSSIDIVEKIIGEVIVEE